MLNKVLRLFVEAARCDSGAVGIFTSQKITVGKKMPPMDDKIRWMPLRHNWVTLRISSLTAMPCVRPLPYAGVMDTFSGYVILGIKVIMNIRHKTS